MVKVVTVNEGEETELGEYDSLSSIEVRGATGGVKYSIDTKQDFLVKIVVNGNVMTHEAKTKDGKTVNVDELQGLTPQDLPVPQIQTGDAGDSSKALDTDGNPVYPEKKEEKSSKDKDAKDDDAKASPQPVAARK